MPDVRSSVQLFVVVLLLGFPFSGRAAPLLDPRAPATRLALAGLEALDEGDSSHAQALLDRYNEEHSDDPIAPLLRMKLWWWAILEGRGEFEPQLEADFARLREVAQTLLDRDPNDVRALYALGEAHCTMGRLHGVRGEAWAALRSHRRGTPLLERALALDPALPEPLASLGVYHYYSARAPAFLRFLARFLSVQADRERGLQELWRAASQPGMQQAEAAFFLIEILANVEDDPLEALPIALRMRALHPQSLRLGVALASVQMAMERPDLAVEQLRRFSADELTPESIAARFFVARTLAASGRAVESVAALESFTAVELESVSWLAGWHAYYLGVSYAQLGRTEDAERAFRLARAAPEVAESHSFAKRELERADAPVLRSVRAAEAKLAWGEELESTSLIAALQGSGHRDREVERRAVYALGLLELRRGRHARAAELLSDLIDSEDGDDAWLVTRPRLRYLQALLWSGQVDEAREAAVRLRPRLGRWGSNRQLELLIQTCLQPRIEPPEFVLNPEPLPSERLTRFRLKDLGFTGVHLRRLDGAVARKHAMRHRGGFWEVEIPLSPGSHLYRFEIESQLQVPDPAALEVRDRGGALWSVRAVEAVMDS
jgi:tetratricopeptide (TPR) repeat protein